MSDEEWGCWAEEIRVRLARSIPMKLDDLIGQTPHGRGQAAAYRRRIAVYVLYRLDLGRDDVAKVLAIHPTRASKAKAEIAERMKASADFRGYVERVVEKMECAK